MQIQKLFSLNLKKISSSYSVSEHNSTIIDKIVEGSSLSGIAYRLKRKDIAIKRLVQSKASLDYARDRDVDVEGVEDYVLWHENFKTDTQLPLIPR